MSDYLPDELIFRILERLPVKSLIRSTSVCKSWYSVIRSPRFITQHLNRVNNSPHQIVENEKVLFAASVADKRKIGLYSLSSDNSCYNHLNLDVSDGSALCDVGLVGTCSGLVCLLLNIKNAQFDRVIIWNPSIRKAVSILCTESSPLLSRFYGFFVDPISQHYKLLALHCHGDTGAPHHIEIYRQHTRAWSAINNSVFPRPLDHYYLQASVNGVVYWLISDWTDCDSDNPRIVNSIASFNMHTEAISHMMLPPSVAHTLPIHLGLMFSRESLILYEVDVVGDHICGYSIWVMKEDGVSESWCKLFNVEMAAEEWLTPLGLRMNGELLLTTKGKSLVCHDPLTNRTTTIAIEGSAQTQCTEADTYVESLLLLNANADSEHDSFGEFLFD